MRKHLIIAATVLGLSAPTWAATSTPPTTVNGTPIPASRLNTLLKQFTAQGEADTPELRNMLNDQLVMTELLRQQAVKQGLEKSQAYRDQMENLASSVLANLYVSDWIQKNPVTDAQLRTRYDSLRTEMAQQELHARHILVANEKEALDLLEQLRKGRRFDELAQAHSLDPGSRPKGGDLGWASASVYDADFSAALGQLQRGQITSKPVKSQFGWHIIQLVDTREANVPPFETIRAQLTQYVQNELLQKHLDFLKKSAKIQ